MVEFNTSAPPSVRKAIHLLGGVVGIFLLSNLLEYWQRPANLTVVGDTTLAFMNIFIGVLALGANAVFLRMRIRWSRYLLGAMFVLGLPSLIGASARSFGSGSPMLGFLFLAQLAAEAYILYLLFTPPASDWFEAE